MSSDAPTPWWRLPSRLVFIGFLAIGTFFLMSEHRAHTLGLLPYVLLLACPLMHFLHGDYGKRAGPHRHKDPSNAR